MDMLLLIHQLASVNSFNSVKSVTFKSSVEH